MNDFPDMDWCRHSHVSPTPGHRMEKNKRSMMSSEEQNKALVTESEETEIEELPDKESKIVVSRKLNKTQDNPEKQFKK